LILYYITDRTQFPGAERERRERLLERISEAASSGVDFIQLREKDLSGRQLEFFGRTVVERVRSIGSTTRLLINSRVDVAISIGADGVHLRSSDISPREVRKIWRLAQGEADPVIGVSCHTRQEVTAAQENSANFIVFGPVFGKVMPDKTDAQETRTAGLERLRGASPLGISVLALGGVTLENAASCIQAGAAGIAGIRVFQEGDLVSTVKLLRRS
jgi:thiamine-phosphate pyrophosphorylase